MEVIRGSVSPRVRNSMREAISETPYKLPYGSNTNPTMNGKFRLLFWVLSARYPAGNRYLFLYSIGAAAVVAVVYHATSGREG